MRCSVQKIKKMLNIDDVFLFTLKSFTFQRISAKLKKNILQHMHVNLKSPPPSQHPYTLLTLKTVNLVYVQLYFYDFSFLKEKSRVNRRQHPPKETPLNVNCVARQTCGQNLKDPRDSAAQLVQRGKYTHTQKKVLSHMHIYKMKQWTLNYIMWKALSIRKDRLTY